MRTFDEINTLLGGSETAANWSQHANGGGWVRKDAEVHPESFIGGKAIVFSHWRKAKVMRGGVMHGGVMHGGVMRGGEMWGGEMWGGVMWGGVWNTSPLFVQGTRHSLCNAKPGFIQIGCKCMPYAWWKSEEAMKFARANDYTEEQIKEYEAYIALFKKIGRPAEEEVK